MFWNKKKKTRSDKKVQIAPTIPVKTKKKIEIFAEVTDQSVMLIGKMLFLEGIHQYAVISKVAPHLQNGILRIDNKYIIGTNDNPMLRVTNGKTARISMRFNKKEYGDVYLLGSLLEVSDSHAVASIIIAAIDDVNTIERILKYNSNRTASEIAADKELKKLMRFVNRDYTYKDKPIEKDAIKVSNKSRFPNSKNPNLAVDNETYKWEFE